MLTNFCGNELIWYMWNERRNGESEILHFPVVPAWRQGFAVQIETSDDPVGPRVQYYGDVCRRWLVGDMGMSSVSFGVFTGLS